MSSQITNSSFDQAFADSMKKLGNILLALIAASVIIVLRSIFIINYLFYGNVLSWMMIISTAIMIYVTLRLCLLSNISRIVNICAGVICICEAFVIAWFLIPPISDALYKSGYQDMTFRIIECLFVVLLPICLLLLSNGVRETTANKFFALSLLCSPFMCVASLYSVELYYKQTIGYWGLMITGIGIFCYYVKHNVANAPLLSDQNGIEETNPDYYDEQFSLNADNDNEQDYPEVCYCLPNAVFAVLYKTISVPILAVSVYMLFHESDRMFGLVLLPIALLINWLYNYLYYQPIFFPVQLSISKEGITCNKISSDTLLWNSISNIENNISDVRVRSAPVYAITNIIITLKFGEKHKLRLYFSNENEAEECCSIIQTYYRRFR